MDENKSNGLFMSAQQSSINRSITLIKWGIASFPGRQIKTRQYTDTFCRVVTFFSLHILLKRLIGVAAEIWCECELTPSTWTDEGRARTWRNLPFSSSRRLDGRKLPQDSSRDFMLTLRFYQHSWCSPGPPQLGAFTLDVAPDVINYGSVALKVT